MMTDPLQSPSTRSLVGPMPKPFRVKAAIVTAEVVALGAVFLLVPMRALGYEGFHRWKLLGLMAAAIAVARAHFLRHRDEYRSVPLTPIAVASHGVVLFAALVWLVSVASHSGDPQPWDRVVLAIGLAIGLAWLVTLLWIWVPNRRELWSLVGKVLFIVAGMWLAGLAAFVTGLFWQISSEPTIKSVEWLLTPLAGDTVIRPEAYVIGTPAFQVEISHLCSGYQGIGLIMVLLAGYLWWFRDIHRFPQCLLLFPLGMACSYLANILRITALLLVGIWISPDIAVDGFHLQAGWILFVLLGSGIILGARRTSFFTRRWLLEDDPADGRDVAASIAFSKRPPDTHATTPTVAASHPPSTVACLVPFLVLGGSGMLTAAFTSGFDRLYPVRVVAVAWALVRLRKHFPPFPATGLVSPGAIGIGACTFALWMALESGEGAADPEKVAALDPAVLGEPWGTLWLLFRVAGYTITVPIAEELAFRGFLTRRCIDDDVESVPVGTFTWPSFLLSSLAFGLLHWPSWIAGTLAGIAFALALYQRRRLADAIAAHATTNALLSVWVIGTGSWDGWG